MSEIFSQPVAEFLAVGLRNEHVELTILPDVGAKVISLRNRHTGREWMWSPPDRRPFAQLPVGTPFEQSSLVGADELLPTIAPCQWQGRDLPPHGELWPVPWEVDRLAMTQSRIVTRTELSISPFWIERTISLEERTFTFDYALRNLDLAPQEFMWAFHPLMTISEGDQLQLLGDVRQVRVEAVINVPLGGRGDLYAWPQPIEEVALDQLDLGGRKAAVKLFTEPHAASGAIIQNERTGDTLRLEFDSRQVDTLGIWLTRGGWNGYHHLALEPGIGAPDSLEVAVNSWRRFGLLMPNETLRWRFHLTLDS